MQQCEVRTDEHLNDVRTCLSAVGRIHSAALCAPLSSHFLHSMKPLIQSQTDPISNILFFNPFSSVCGETWPVLSAAQGKTQKLAVTSCLESQWRHKHGIVGQPLRSFFNKTGGKVLPLKSHLVNSDVKSTCECRSTRYTAGCPGWSTPTGGQPGRSRSTARSPGGTGFAAGWSPLGCCAPAARWPNRCCLWTGKPFYPGADHKNAKHQNT